MTRRWTALPASVLLAGCTVGPHYRERAPVPLAAGAFQVGQAAVDPAGPLPDRWWSLYDDPDLDALVAEALAHNSDLRVAAANVERAQAVLREQRASLLPSTEVTASAVRARGGNFASGSSTGTGSLGTSSTGTTTGAGSTGTGSTGTGNSTTGTSGLTSTNYQTQNILKGGFSLAYEVDLFGRIRRSIEAARGDLAAEEATRDATRVTVAAAVTQGYFDSCLLGVRVDVANRGVGILDATLQGIRRQVALGVGSPYDIARQAVQVEEQQAVASQLDGLRAQALYDLTRLLGRPATDVPAVAIRCRRVPKLSRPIPVGDGARLIARRPDVRSAERTLAADTARVGVATADLFPTITLGGSLQSAGTGLKSAFTRNGTSFSVGPFLTWYIPNIAAARAQIQEASAQARASLASFDGVVLQALNEVQRALAGYDAEIRRNQALDGAVADSRRALAIANKRVQLGSISQLELIQVQNDLVTAEANLAESNATLGDDQVVLFRALGGGWQDAPAIDPTPRALGGTARP
jgi:NodT family efflux transporter outer membrane factor (OMF) lipoprotein